MSEIHSLPLTGADAEIIARAASLRELLRREAAAGEQQRNITDVTFAALRDAGLLQLGVARRWGGQQATWRTILLTLAELARGDASAAWVAMICNNAAYSALLTTDKAQEEIWGTNPLATVTGVYNPAGTSEKVDGGFILNGKWPFNSGCLRADWAQLAFPILAADGSIAEVQLALIPYTDLMIEDTWYVAGMRSTGSNTAVASNLFVPEYRLITYEALKMGNSRSEHPGAKEVARPLVSAEVLAMTGPLLGTGLAALDLARQALDRGRPITGGFYQRAFDSPAYQMNYATAIAKVDTAFFHLLRAADDLDRTVGREPADNITCARIRMDAAVALQNLRDAVALALNIGGAASFADANPINRVWRDFETGSRHALLNPGIAHESYARVLFGLEPTGII